MGNGRAVIATVVIIVGIVGIAVGAMYVSMPAHSLPSFFPGHIVHSNLKHTKRGIAGLAVGAVLVIVGVALFSTGRGRRHRRY